MDSECYTEATPSLYGSDEDSDVEQDSQVVQGQVQERVVEEEVQNLTVERMIPPIRFGRGGLRSQIILGEEIL